MLGLAVCTVYTVWCLETVSFLSRAMRTEGTVIDSEPHRSVSFSLANGTRYTFVQNGRLNASIGQHVPVGYLPEEPHRSARVVTPAALWGIPLRFIPAFLGFGIAPIIGVVLDERARRRPR